MNTTANLVTALAALTALVVIPYQIAQADRIQREQTAREIYREFLNLTVQKPELAVAEYCALPEGALHAAYEGYAEYMLYTAEQALSVSPDWDAPMQSHLAEHRAYLCALEDAEIALYSDALQRLIRTACSDCSGAASC